MTATMIGRAAELAGLQAFFRVDRIGPRTALIEGEPGMGKTTLWSTALLDAESDGWRILQARPTDAEATFAYAGLGDLLDPRLHPAIDQLPAPQARALRAALLLDETDGLAVDAHAVAVSLLGVLRSLAAAHPVCVAIDDIQWLDEASAATIAFAVRRLGDDEPIRFLLARRAGPIPADATVLDRALDDADVLRIGVGPMATDDIRELIRARDIVAPGPRSLRRIQESAGGNPLYALELARAAGSDDGDRGEGIPRSLLALLDARIEALPSETVDVLALIAMAAAPTRALIDRAVDGPADDLLEPAFADAIVTRDGDLIRFTHPLLASAVRGRTPAARRRAVHQRLAAVVGDREQRARHLALVASGPDEAIAAELEAAAERALTRGAPEAAELALEARRLTPVSEVDAGWRREYLAGWCIYRAGDPVRGREIFERIIEAGPDASSYGLALLRRAALVTHYVDPRRGMRYYEELLALDGIDDRVRMEAEGILTAAFDLIGEDFQAALAHGYAELEIAERLESGGNVSGALRGIARNEQRLTGRVSEDAIARSMALEPQTMASDRLVSQWPTVVIAEAMAWTDEIGPALDRFAWVLGYAVDRAEVTSIKDILRSLSLYECIAGRYESALRHADDADEFFSDAGSPGQEAIAKAVRAVVNAHLGDERACRDDVDRVIVLIGLVDNPFARRLTDWALGHLELSLGDHAAADAHLGPLVASRRKAGIAEPGDMRFVPDEVEALIGLGRRSDAEELLTWYEDLARKAGRRGALAACDRARGLLAAASGDLETAATDLHRSLELYEGLEEPLGRGRTLLVLGNIERRRAHRRAAREALDQAVAIFDAIGAAQWARNARAELGRIGGRTASHDVLTPSERRVATLVAEGHTNREVAAELVLTERTIEGHLSNVYAKLGVRSRAELARRLALEADGRS